jgi:spore coat protein U-like protein
MKKLGLLAAMMASLISISSQAATTTSNFNVDITLTSACAITVAPGAVTFTYISMQGAAAAAVGTSFDVTCTNGLPYTAMINDSSGTGAGPGVYGITDAATNLSYTLDLNGGGDLAGVGSGAAQTINIGGTMAANQAGTCGAGSCTNAASANRTQTLTISY